MKDKLKLEDCCLTIEQAKELLKGHEKGLSLESSYEDDENSLIETYKNQLKK